MQWKYPPAIFRLGSPPKSVLSWKPSLWNQRKRNPAIPFRNQLSSFEYILLSCWGRTCGRLCRRVLLVPPGDWRYTLSSGDISITIDRQTMNPRSLLICFHDDFRKVPTWGRLSYVQQSRGSVTQRARGTFISKMLILSGIYWWISRMILITVILIICVCWPHARARIHI